MQDLSVPTAAASSSAGLKRRPKSESSKTGDVKVEDNRPRGKEQDGEAMDMDGS